MIKIFNIKPCLNIREKTHDRIKKLIDPDMLGGLTEAVLVNSVYFKGDFAISNVPFPKYNLFIIAGWNFGKFDHVREATFTRLSREEITVKMMSTNAHVGEARLEGKEWLRSISPSILWSQSSALWSS